MLFDAVCYHMHVQFFARARRRLQWRAPVIALLLFAGAHSVGSSADRVEVPHVTVLLVGNFRDVRPGKDTAWIGAAVVEELRDRLHTVPGLVSFSRVWIGETLREPPMAGVDLTATGDIARLARRLGSRRIVAGTWAVRGTTVRFAAQVLDPDTLAEVGSAAVSVSLYRPADIACRLAEELAPLCAGSDLPRSVIARMSRPATESREAYEAFGRACAASDAKERLKRCGEALRRDPRFTSALLLRARTLHEMERPEQAEAAYRDVFAVEQTCEAARVEMAHLFAGCGQVDVACAQLDLALGMKSEDTWARVLRAQYLEQQGRLDLAETDLDAAVALGYSVAEIHTLRGIIHTRRGEYPQALEELNLAVAGAAQNLRLHVARATALLGAGEYAAALEEADRAVALAPDQVASLATRARVLSAMKEPERAIADLDRAIALAPRDPELIRLRATEHERAGNISAAIRDCSLALKIEPASIALRRLRARLYWLDSQFDRAVEDLDQVIAAGEDAAAYHARGSAYLRKGDLERAFRDLDRAIALDGANAEFYATRARAWLAKGNYARAWDDVARCQALGGTVEPRFLRDLRQASGRDK